MRGIFPFWKIVKIFKDKFSPCSYKGIQYFIPEVYPKMKNSLTFKNLANLLWTQIT